MEIVLLVSVRLCLTFVLEVGATVRVLLDSKIMSALVYREDKFVTRLLSLLSVTVSRPQQRICCRNLANLSMALHSQ